MPDNVRYLISPGYVRSRNDGDMHWISVPQLVKLYGLRPGEWREYHRSLDQYGGLPILGPRNDGDYVLPPEDGR
jgi:hypothetical protein